MTDFLLALAFVLMLLFVFWIVSRLDRYVDIVKTENDEADCSSEDDRESTKR